MRILRYIVPAMALICWLPMSVYGLSWLSQTSNTTNSLEDITWGGSQYVAVGWNGTIVTSPDGATWTVQISNAGSTTRLHNVIWSGTQFVAVGGPPPSETGTGVIVTSPDGVTWTSQTSGAANPLNSVVWSGTQFVAVGNGGTIVTSPNGVLWTARTGGTTEHNNEVIWNGTRFVVVGGERYSVDGGGQYCYQSGRGDMDAAAS